MENDIVRVASFSSWPQFHQFSPLRLARNGFYYSGEGDRVTCFKCSVQLDNWTSADDVVERHRQQSPNCQLLSETNKENIPLASVSNGDLGITESDLAATKHLPGSEEIQEIYKGALARATRRGVLSTNPVNKIDRSTPDYDKLRHEKLRLSTFYDWPSGAQADPQALAREGLFYTGMEDRVQCAFCRGFMSNLESTDIPSMEHKKHFPDCPFVRGLDVGNISMTEILASDYSRKACGVDPHQHVQNSQPLRTECTRSSIIEQIRYVAPTGYSDPPKYPEFSDFKRRIESFKKGKVAPGHTAKTLAEAGWFFIGPGDKVQCFHCGGNLKDWEPEDDPWDEHKRWYGNCLYFKNHRPATIRQQLQEQTRPTTMTATAAQYRVEPREVKARMDTATVRAILDMGYSRELVRKAIEDQLSTTGDDFPNAESLLEAIFLMEASNPVASASGFTSTTSSVASHDTSRLSLMPSSSSATVGSSSSSTSSSRSTPLCNNTLDFADSHSLPAPNQSSSDTSTSVFQSLVSRPSEQLPASATVSKVNPQETVADALSKSKGRRKRNKKKKTSAASNAAETGEEDQAEEAAIGAENDLEHLPQLGELSLSDIPDEETLQYVEENRRLREARSCKVCMDAEVNTVFLPCGHLVCCNKCSPVLRNCPICRTFIRGTVKTFLS